MTTTAKVFKYTGFGILGVGAVFLFIWVVMLLWNALIPDLFKGPELTYWQTAGIFILAKILFSGFSGGGHSDNHKSNRSKWHARYQEKYQRRFVDEDGEMKNKPGEGGIDD